MTQPREHQVVVRRVMHLQATKVRLFKTTISWGSVILIFLLPQPPSRACARLLARLAAPEWMP